jgi:hypothetical protein
MNRRQRGWFGIEDASYRISGKLGEPKETHMRTILMIAAVAAVLLSGVRTGDAYYGHGPWCAVQSLGSGVVTENCSMLSFEQCRLEVVAGNRGFCTPNPYWADQAKVLEPVKRGRRGAR